MHLVNSKPQLVIASVQYCIVCGNHNPKPKPVLAPWSGEDKIDLYEYGGIWIYSSLHHHLNMEGIMVVKAPQGWSYFSYHSYENVCM